MKTEYFTIYYLKICKIIQISPQDIPNDIKLVYIFFSQRQIVFTGDEDPLFYFRNTKVAKQPMVEYKDQNIENKINTKNEYGNDMDGDLVKLQIQDTTN